jgi:hypothetical protein
MADRKTEAVKPDVLHREHDDVSDDMTQNEDALQRRISRRPSAAVNVIQNPLQVCLSAAIEYLSGARISRERCSEHVDDIVPQVHN